MNTSEPSAPVPRDVRMKGFASRATVDQALEWVDRQTATPLPEEEVALDQAAGRVLAVDVVSAVDVPSFRRAMMDGYAVRAEDTMGASVYNRLPLQVIGQALPGRPFAGRLAAGQAVRIMTGAPIPEGADAVLPVERTQPGDSTVLAVDQVAPQKHLGVCGEDIGRDTQVLRAGRRLRPQDVGLLSSIGWGHIPVIRPARVRILVTGDELLPPGTRPSGYRIADANGPMLGALVRRDGGTVVADHIVADEPAAILQAMQDEVEVVLVSGGSSVGQEDHAPRLLAEHGTLAIHGVAMRPSSPAGMGRLGSRLVFLLPGNPVSCLCAYDFFAGRALRALTGRGRAWPYRQQPGILRRKLVSQIGRVDYARVAWRNGQVEPLAISGASVLSSTTRADGFVIIPQDSEGYPAGQEVNVFLYD